MTANKKKKPNEVVLLLLKTVSLGLALLMLFTVVFGVLIIKDNNMYPRISEGDILFYYRISNEYVAGDVVVCDIDGKTVISRIIAINGDTVDFTKDGRIMVNGGPLGQESFYEVSPDDSATTRYPIEVGENEYFLLSDYSTEQEIDSRSFGTVNEKDIKGKTITVVRRRGF